MSVAISAFRMQTMFGSSLSLVVCRRAPALFTLFECLRIVVSNTYCVVLCYVLFVFVLCPVYPMLPIFSGLSFLIAHSVSLTFIFQMCLLYVSLKEQFTTGQWI